jgi:hypothetical protein
MSSATHDDEEGGHQGGDQAEDDDNDVDDVDYDELGMSQLDDAPQGTQGSSLLHVHIGRVDQWTGSL